MPYFNTSFLKGTLMKYKFILFSPWLLNSPVEIVPTLGSKVYKYYLLWAFWRFSDCVDFSDCHAGAGVTTR